MKRKILWLTILCLLLLTACLPSGQSSKGGNTITVGLEKRYFHSGFGEDDMDFRDGQAVKLIFRPEDVFLRKPENLTQNYQKLTDGTVEEASFAGAFERVVIKLNLSAKKPIVVVRPKTETAAFPLAVGQNVMVGLVRFRILPDKRN